MNWTPELTELRITLATLYEDEASARRVVAEAGLNVTTVTWGTNSTNYWYAILNEAQKHSKVAALVAVALQEYGNNKKLLAAAAPFYELSTLPPPAQPKPNSTTTAVTLTRDERRQLIDLLLKLPNIADAEVRALLLANLPTGLQQSIPMTRTVAIDIPRLVDSVQSEAWSPLPDGTYPLIVVIENAIDLARGSRLAVDLQTVLTALNTRNAGSAPLPLLCQVLSGEQRRALYTALLSAYGDHGALERMVSFGLNEKLAVIAGGKNLAEIILNLINWAESSGKVTELLDAARQENPGNPELKAVAQQWGIG